jgi:hypothetical protein
MSDITEVFQVEISGILVLSYDKDDEAPDPKSWDLPVLLDELTMTMHASPTATLTLVHSNYQGIEAPVPTQEEYIPGYCQGCVRIEMDKLDYSQVFPAFKVVASDHCDGCTEDESFAECPNNCADWKTPLGVSCSCECHA